MTPPGRIDYFDAPDAPRPAPSSRPSTSSWPLPPATSCLIRRTDNGNWALPGGAIDLGESVAQAACRETLEETGIECAITRIVGIYSDPQARDPLHQQRRGTAGVSIVLTAQPLRGQPTPSIESSEVRWVPEAELLCYTIDRSMRIRINDFLSRNDSPVIT